MKEGPNIFTAVADPTRRGLLELLRRGATPAGELVRSFPTTSQPGISRHLRVLRESGLVEVRRDEQRWIYSLRSQGFAEMEAWLSRYHDYGPTQPNAHSRRPDAQSPLRQPTLSRKKAP